MTVPRIPPADLSTGYNPFEPAQRDDPYPVYARARREQPVFFSQAMRAWIVTRHEDICMILRDPERFSSSPPGPSGPKNAVQQILESRYADVPILVTCDPPRHTRLRRFLSRVLGSERVAALEPKIHAHAHALVDRFIGDRTAELIGQFMEHLPMQSMAELLGVPEPDREALFRQFRASMRMFLLPLPLEQQIECANDFVAVQQYYAALIERRRAEPSADLTSALLHCRIDGEEPLRIEETIGLLSALAIGGSDTTTYLIANAVRLLLDHPEHMAAIRSAPQCLSDFVEECIRADTPVQGLMRYTTETVMIGGVRLPAGATVQVMFAAANHDESHFIQPEHLDVQRANLGQHLSFGRGIHFCSGAALARLQTRVAIRVLLDRLPGLRLQQGTSLTYLPSPTLRRLHRLPVAWD